MNRDSLLLVVSTQLIPQVLMFSLFLTHLTGSNGVSEAEEQLCKTTSEHFAEHFPYLSCSLCGSWETPASTAQGFVCRVFTESRDDDLTF